jgi:hypothetical protein
VSIVLILHKSVIGVDFRTIRPSDGFLGILTSLAFSVPQITRRKFRVYSAGGGLGHTRLASRSMSRKRKTRRIQVPITRKHSRLTSHPADAIGESLSHNCPQSL